MDVSKQDRLYEEASAAHSAAIARLARAYEAAPDKRSELRQEIHIALWRSFAGFNGRCSLRTWVYRVAHNTAASHVIQSKRANPGRLISLDDLDAEPTAAAVETDRNLAFERLMELIQRLRPLDRQVISLYLEGESGFAIAEITGISPSNVAVKIHRIKAVLSRRFEQGGRHAELTQSP